MAIVNALDEMYIPYVIFSDQVISPDKLKTDENGSIDKG